jgi:uncharacterized protein (DUF1697 family)
MTVISLLRGINLGGHHKVPMNELRALYESLGFSGARTFIQSGNVVFSTKKKDLKKITSELEAEIERRFGFCCSVVQRSLAEWDRTIAKNPFAGRSDIEPSKLLVIFLAADPGQTARDAVMAIPAEPEQVRAIGSELYIYYPDGMARPKLPLTRIDKTLGTNGTGRNWNTVLKLRELAQEIEAS